MLYPFSLFTSASALLLAATSVVASPLQARDDVMTPTPGVQVMINSGQDFCLFLPPQPGLEVAPHESDGKPFCSQEGAITGAQKFPDGMLHGYFLKSRAEGFTHTYTTQVSSR